VGFQKHNYRLTKVNPDGTVPVLKDNDTGDFIYDSDVISDYLEEKFAPDKEITKRSLGKMVDCPQPGRNLMQAFFDFITDKADKSAVEKELRQIDEAVGDKQPYVGGQEPNAYDVALAPRLHIARVCCKAFKEWDFGDDFPQVKAYIHRWTGRSSWRNTASWNDESIVEDIKAKLDKMASEK
jgi:glutathione S-transferase